MSLHSRKLSVALLATMVLSLAAVSLHVATHATGHLQTCELCSGHANPSHALPPAELTLEPVVAELFVFVEPLGTHTSAPTHAYRSRGPPEAS